MQEGSSSDLDELRRAHEELRRSEERFALAVAGSRDAIWDWDLESGRIFYATRWKELLGVEDQALRDDPEEWFERILPQHLQAFRSALRQHIEGRAETLELEMEMRHADGGTRWVLCRASAVRDERGRAKRIAGSLADITELKRAQCELQHASLHDRLTDLPNRALLMERLGYALERARRDPQFCIALLFFDFDRFKLVNDSLGHRAGDALLVSIAARLREQLREVDTVARLGGDEFVVLLEGVGSVSAAEEVAQRLLEACARPHRIGGRDIVSTASIGLVSSEMGYAEPDAMLRDADAAMYEAKARGKARYRVFDGEMHAAAVERLELEEELRSTCDGDGFRLLYQPIVSLNSARVEGVEAVVRWQHPSRGPLASEHFLAVAEETGLVIPIGEWMLRQAGRQLAAWRTALPDADGLFVSLDVSHRQLHHPGFGESLERVLAEHSIPTGGIRLEVDERAMLDGRHDAGPAIEKIRALGVPIALDHFGSGASALRSLQQFPIDLLKVDGSFIAGIEGNRQFSAVVHSVVTLARHSGVGVVADGLETLGQLGQVQAMGCDYGQGRLFGEPFEAERLPEFLAGIPGLG